MKIPGLLLLVCASIALAAGCKKKIPRKWDYPNENITILVNNSAGEDMLSATARPTLFDNVIRLTYKGQTTPCLKPDHPTTRASEPKLPVFEGLTYHLGRNPRYLTLGEFSIDTQDYRAEKFTVDWGDGTSTDFEFDLYHTDNGDNEPTIHRAIRATGGAGAGASSPKSLSITIVKP